MKAKTILFCLLLCVSKSEKSQAQNWQAMPGGSLNDNVSAIFDDGTYRWVSGNFTQAGALSAYHIVRHDGYNWLATDSLPSEARCFVKYNNEIYACGQFIIGSNWYGVMKWNGTKFIPFLRISPGNGIYDAVVHQGKLVVGGWINTINGNPACGIAQFDGANWSPVTFFVSSPSATCRFVYSLFSDAARLYIGGEFNQINSQVIQYVGYLESGVWYTTNFPPYVSQTFGQSVYKLLKYYGDIFAIGLIQGDGSTDCPSVLRYDSLQSSWQCVGGGVSMQMKAAAISCGKLYVGGLNIAPYPQINAGIPIRGIGSFDGISSSGGGWVDETGNLFGGMYRVLYAGQGDTLYAGGNFNQVIDGSITDYMAYTVSCPPITLPVELSSFDCMYSNSVIRISWRTLSEVNSSYFDVSVSFDGIEYLHYASVAAAGNSSEPHSYSIDYKPEKDDIVYNNIVYIRLSQFDQDGGSKGNWDCAVDVNKEDKDMNNKNGNDVTVFDMQGTIVAKGRFSLPPSHLPAGLYCVRIGAQNSVLRFVIR